MKIVNENKNLMAYNPNKACLFCEVYTYEEILNIFDDIERTLKDSRLYKLLRYLLRTEEFRCQIDARRNLKKILEENETETAELKELLHKQDKEVGIIKINSSEYGISIAAGTKKDMELSDKIKAPFAANESYVVHPERDYEDERFVYKTFYNESITNKQKQLIRVYKLKKALLSMIPRDNEQGFIMYAGNALIITRGELLECGFTPKDVNWKPLKIKTQKLNIFTSGDIFSDGSGMAIKKVLQLHRK